MEISGNHISTNALFTRAETGRERSPWFYSHLPPFTRIRLISNPFFHPVKLLTPNDPIKLNCSWMFTSELAQLSCLREKVEKYRGRDQRWTILQVNEAEGNWENWNECEPWIFSFYFHRQSAGKYAQLKLVPLIISLFSIQLVSTLLLNKYWSDTGRKQLLFWFWFSEQQLTLNPMLCVSCRLHPLV